MSNKRAIALVAAAAAIFPFVFASPGHAIDAAANCHTLLAGPTPSIEIDKESDGNPEVRVPSITNASICLFGGVRIDDSPGVWAEPCDWEGACQRYLVHYTLDGEASASAQVCFSLDGLPICGTTTPVAVPLNIMRGGTMCIGIDLNGGSPCGGGTSFVSFS